MDALTDPMIASQFGRLERHIAELEATIAELQTVIDANIKMVPTEVAKVMAENAKLREAIKQHKSVVYAGPGHDFPEDVELWAALLEEK